MGGLSIRVLRAGIPLTPTRPAQKWLDEWGFQVYVKVEAEGLAGWGEALPAALNSTATYAKMAEEYAGLLAGVDHRDIRGVWERMYRASFSGGHGVTTGAMSAIDMALWDLRAKELGVPLQSLLGSTTGRARRYASLARYSGPEDVLKVVAGLLEEGFTLVKIHQGREDTLDTMRLIRKELGYEPKIAVDLNCAFRYEDARGFAEKIARFEPYWVEEPVWPHDDYDALAKLNRVVPIAAGENEFSINQFKTMLEKEAATYYQPDAAKVGGITPLLDLVSLFKAYNVGIAFHNRPHNGWISTIASACVAIGTHIDAWVETPPTDIPKKYFEHRVALKKDQIFPEGPGISIRPREPLPEPGASKPLIFHGET